MLKISYHYVTKKILVLLFVEAVILFASAYFGALIRFFGQSVDVFSQNEHLSISASLFAFVTDVTQPQRVRSEVRHMLAALP